MMPYCLLAPILLLLFYFTRAVSAAFDANDVQERKMVMGLISQFFAGNALHSAIKENDTKRLKHLLNTGSSPNEKRFGRIPLLLAARNANIEAVRLLIEKTNKTQALDRHGNMALMLAAGGWGYKGNDKEAKCFAVVKMLLEGGADPNVRGRRGQPAMRYALGAGHKRIMDLLTEYSASIEQSSPLGQMKSHPDLVIQANRPVHNFGPNALIVNDNR